MQQVMIKFTTDFTPIVKHVIKYANLFNRVINMMKKYDIFIETFDNGFMFVYPSKENGEKFFSFTYGEKSLNIQPIHKFKDRYLQNIFFSQKDFPKEGLYMKIQIFPKVQSEFFKQKIKSYYTAISKDFILTEEGDKLLLWIKSYGAIETYVNLLIEKFKFKKVFLK